MSMCTYEAYNDENIAHKKMFMGKFTHMYMKLMHLSFEYSCFMSSETMNRQRTSVPTVRQYFT